MNPIQTDEIGGNGFMDDANYCGLHKGKDQARKSDARNPICVPARISQCRRVGGKRSGKRRALAEISRRTALTKINPLFATQ